MKGIYASGVKFDFYKMGWDREWVIWFKVPTDQVRLGGRDGVSNQGAHRGSDLIRVAFACTGIQDPFVLSLDDIISQLCGEEVLDNNLDFVDNDWWHPCVNRSQYRDVLNRIKKLEEKSK